MVLDELKKFSKSLWFEGLVLFKTNKTNIKLFIIKEIEFL